MVPIGSRYTKFSTNEVKKLTGDQLTIAHQSTMIYDPDHSFEILYLD